jgi:hypothetical protein
MLMQQVVIEYQTLDDHGGIRRGLQLQGIAQVENQTEILTRNSDPSELNQPCRVR